MRDDHSKKVCCIPEDHEDEVKPEDTTSVGPEDTTSVEPEDTTSVGPEDTTSVGPEDTTPAGPEKTTPKPDNGNGNGNENGSNVFCEDKKNPKTGRSDCPKLVKYCNHPRYYDLMTNRCAKTCNRCGGKDKNGSRRGAVFIKLSVSLFNKGFA
ncbi:hypothetical protein WR25_26770 [Diploscapter pachys]|uniref:ShKT domain-containing protein n=1 Tax=Diploscapter pachys TaxID=2018661 RepID=A0A2A2KU39_9BILA|nr:hypothetical protein WR25_26770 [Diploscapter pachys]